MQLVKASLFKNYKTQILVMILLLEQKMQAKH